MKLFIECEDRVHSTLFPELLDDWIGEDNPVRVIDVFVDELDLGGLGFGRVEPRATGRPGYHPSVLLKLYIYGYLNRVQSSRRLEREAGRNVEVMWLTGRLVPGFRDNEVRLQPHALAYNLGNFPRTLALPEAVGHWSLTTLREKLIKIGAKVARHGRYVIFQMAEVAIPRDLFAEILGLIDRLRPAPLPP